MMNNKVSPKMKKVVNNLEDSLRPLLLLNSFMGLSIFEISSDNPWPIVSFFYAFVRFVIIYVIGFYYVTVYIPKKYYITSIIFQVLKIYLLFSASTSLVTTIFSLKYYKVIITYTDITSWIFFYLVYFYEVYKIVLKKANLLFKVT